jgi:hypothetical protein
MIQSVIHKLLVDLLCDDMKAMITRKGDHSIPALVEFIAGGLFGVMRGWLGGNAPLSVEELNALFRRLAIPAVRSAFPQSYGGNWKRLIPLPLGAGHPVQSRRVMRTRTMPVD